MPFGSEVEEEEGLLGMARVEPRRLRDKRAPSASSSYQLLCLVASRLPVSSEALRSASKMVAERSPRWGAAVSLEEATTAPTFRFLRLILWPASSSEEEKSESSLSLAGGGVAGRFRRFALPFAPRFLKMATGAIGVVAASPVVVSVSAIVSVMESEFEELDEEWRFWRKMLRHDLEARLIDKMQEVRPLGAGLACSTTLRHRYRDRKKLLWKGRLTNRPCEWEN